MKMDSQYKKQVHRIIRICFGIAIAIFLHQFDLFYLESLTYDLRVQLKPPSPTSGHVKTIAIDPETVKSLEGTPTAEDHKLFIEQLARANPRAVVYVNNPTELEGSLEDKEAFSQTTEILPAFYYASNLLPIKGHEDQLSLEPPFDNIAVYSGPKTADQKIFAKDGVSRRFIFSYYGHPTLHPMLARTYNGLEFQDEYQGLWEFLGTYQGFIDYHPSGTYTPLSFLDVLRGNFNPQDLRDKVVFVGKDTLESSQDYILTPFSREVVAMPLVEMHANIMDTLILNRSPAKVPWWQDLFFTILISVWTVFVVLTMRPLRGIGVLAGTMVGFIMICFLAFALGQIWIGMAHPLLAIFISYYFFIPYRLIMENRKSWEYIQRNKLLTQVEELKSNFLRMMSHDLKTPLARIQGMVDVVARDNNPLSPPQADAVTSIRQSAEELSDFIGSILNLGRIESKDVKLHLKAKDINTLLAQITRKAEFLAHSKNIEIVTEFEPIFSTKVDEDLMRQVFTNLIENAIKYSPENSKILISTEEADGKIIVQVADQGIGIPAAERKNIFTKFYRSKGAKNSPIKGSGLGLYLAKYFVELHQGKIGVESEVRKGSTFTVELPMDLET